MLLKIHTGGPNGMMIVNVRPDLDMARNGAGGVHHVSFRTANQEVFTSGTSTRPARVYA